MAKGDDEETSGFSHFMQLSSVAAWKMTVMWGNLLSWPLFAYLAVRIEIIFKMFLKAQSSGQRWSHHKGAACSVPCPLVSGQKDTRKRKKNAGVSH